MKISLSGIIAFTVYFVLTSKMFAVNFNNSNFESDTIDFVYDTVYIDAIGKKYLRGENVTEFADKSNLGGNTSVRNYPADELSWKTQGYFQRNRDLGQVFIPKKDTWVKSIVLRTGPTENAILWNVPGAEMFMQFYEITGTPVINDNGTPQGTESTHGFSTNHRTDDFIEGVTYNSLPTIYHGIFPLDAPVTKDENGNILSDEGSLHYLRWSFEETLLFEANKRYGFIIGFVETGTGYRITLGNNNQASRTDVPSLDDQYTPYKGGWSFRREGDGTLPPTMYPGDIPPNSDTIIEQLKNESLFGTGNNRFTVSPTSDGFPDVDTYRAYEFYIEEDYVALEGIEFTEDTIRLNVTDEFQLVHNFIPQNVSDTPAVTWISTNSWFVSVDSNGKIKANNSGTAVVSVSTNDWKHHASVVVNVFDSQTASTPPASSENNIEIFPNPFSDRIKIFTANSMKQNRITILNSQSQVVRILKPLSDNNPIYEYEWDGKSMNGKEVPSGLYILQYNLQKRKIIKE